jgi:iron complex outermembrane receptor protein
MSRSSKARSRVGELILMALLAASGALPAFAVEVHHFDIPEEGAAAAIRDFGEQAHVQILVAAEAVNGKKLHAVTGELSTEDGLNALLSGSGLTHRYVGDHSIALLAQATQASTQSQVDGPGGADPGTQEGKKDSSGNFLLAQATPGQPSGPVAVETSDEQAAADKKKKAEQLQEVVVTGTHIAGEAPVGTAVHTLDRSEIEASGYATTQQLIQSLTENFRGGAAGASADSFFSSGSFAGYNFTGGEGVNLRGLGNNATLVLINGHRVAPNGFGYFTDISTIPVSAIDHIDVLADGSSAIYGSDAVAGVVNIVLKDSSEGVQTGVRYGAATDGGAESYGADIEVGHKWSDGGFTFGTDYANQSQLYASQRSFTSSFGNPTSLFPSYNQISLTAGAHQEIGDRFEIHSDAQYSHKGVTSFESPGGTESFVLPDQTARWGISVGASQRLFDTWFLRYDITDGDERDAVHGLMGPDGNPTTLYFGDTSRNGLLDQEVSISGDALQLPAGAVKFAVGASHRAEHFSEANEPTPLNIGYMHFASRTVLAEYGEIRLPIFSELNSIPGVHALTISAAIRHDDYSDFGDTTNPKYGLSWFPTNELEIRGAYSTSFRAPSAGTELFSADQGLSSTLLFGEPGPNEGPQVPVLILSGTIPNLRPETARNISLGSTYKPNLALGLTLSGTFYHIVYSNQIAAPPYSPDPLNDPALASLITKYATSAPVQALVASGIAHGAPYLDYTFGAFGPNALANTIYVFNNETANLSSTKASGFDLSASYPVSFGLNQLRTLVELTVLDEYEVKVTPASPAVSQLNSVGNPAKTRLRAQEAWTRGDLNLSIALNYVNGYPDTSSLTPRNVASFTTVDFVVRYHLSNTALPWLDGGSAALSVINLFDRLPPYVVSGDVNFSNASHYDPANASPLGRTINLSLNKSW